MLIKKAPQRKSYIPKGTHPLKCPKCNSWMKKQPDKTLLCLACYFRDKKKEEEAIKEANPEAVVKPNVRIGKL